MRYVSSDDEETGAFGSHRLVSGQLYIKSREISEACDICVPSGPNSFEQQNLEPVQYERNMFYKTTRAIDPGEELFVYYGDDYARYLGIQPFILDQAETIPGRSTGVATSSSLGLRLLRF